MIPVFVPDTCTLSVLPLAENTLVPTVSVAALEVVDPAIFVNTARYCLPLSPAAAVKLYVVLVAPPISVQVVPLALLCHFTVGVGVPLAAAVNVAVKPGATTWFVGWVVTVGATAVTVSVAALVVVEPTTFVKTARYCLPLSDSVVAGVVYVTLVAPSMFDQFRLSMLLCHCTVAAGVLLAAAVNVAVAPTTTVVLEGCVVIIGTPTSCESTALVLAL